MPAYVHLIPGHLISRARLTHNNFGNEMAGIIAGALHGTKDSILEAVEAFRDLGAYEVILNPQSMTSMR